MLRKKILSKISMGRLLFTVSSIAVLIVGMVLISLTVVIFTGLLSGGHHTHSGLESRSSAVDLVVISPTDHIENQIKKSQLDTPQIPKDFSVEMNAKAMQSSFAPDAAGSSPES